MEAESEFDCSRITGIGCTQEGPFAVIQERETYPSVTAYRDSLLACQRFGYFRPSYARTPKYQNHCVEDLD